ncbi:MAG: hypothetical protein JXB85_02235 [Anaerolineales bacterium]|nr:hypothetical protein [Anaerolineales bacterium]
MKKTLPLIILVTTIVMLSSCSPPDTPTQRTVHPLPLANVTCNELSFYMDPALGSGYECETVPERGSSDIPMDVFIYPAHTGLTIQTYPLTYTQFPPQIRIYPVNRFSELLPEVLPRRVSDLERLISSGTWSSGELPFLPPLPMVQTFFSHETVISFNGGQGVRFITEYNESSHPISNRTIFYTFQGLTDDGMYWVAVTLPISSPILPADADFHTLPEGYTSESWFQDYSSYVSDVKDVLEAQTPDSFFPTINRLDSLIRSITVRQ